MSQDRKRSLFASLFGSNNKKQEELEAEKQSHQKLEERIREVLAINDIPHLPETDHVPAWEPAAQANTVSLELVYSGLNSLPPRALLQTGQFSTHLPQYE